MLIWFIYLFLGRNSSNSSSVGTVIVIRVIRLIDLQFDVYLLFIYLFINLMQMQIFIRFKLNLYLNLILICCRRHRRYLSSKLKLLLLGCSYFGLSCPDCTVPVLPACLLSGQPFFVRLCLIANLNLNWLFDLLFILLLSIWIIKFIEFGIDFEQLIWL